MTDFTDNRDKVKQQARSKANTKVKAFLKKVQYQNYVNTGMTPMDAAKKVGVKGLKFWKFYRPGEVERKIEEELGD